MSKAAIAGMLVDRFGITKAQATDMVDTVFDGIEKVLLSRERITIVGFGSLAVREKPLRKNSEPGSTVHFTPSEALLVTVNRGRARRSR